MASVSAEEKMKTNKYLIVVTSEDLLELKVKNINFLFPMTSYSVGFLKTFSFEEIQTPNAYLYINRILDKEAIQNLKEDLKKMPSCVEGICFTDLGVINIVKELDLQVKLIYMQNHNTTNALSINAYLEYVDSVLVSTDITEEEIKTILDSATKPLVVSYFSLVEVMYSRRPLLSNYNENFGYSKRQEELLHEGISNQDFLAIENEYGTVLYAKKFIDYRSIEHENILYRYINPLGLTKEVVENVLKGEDISSISDTGFLYKETYYRLKEGE